jgi:hypothetical protein
MEGEADQGKTPVAQVVSGRGRAAPGSRPYLTLAEIGYLAQVAIVLAFLAVLAVTLNPGYTTSLPSTLGVVVLGLVLSVAWFQLGRNERNSWFLAAGVFGALSVVLSLVQPSESGQNTPGLHFVVLIPVVSIVALIYFATQLLAYNSAARVFQVRLFRYAAYTLAIGFVLLLVGGSAAAILTATRQGGAGQVSSQQNMVSAAVLAFGYIYSAVTSAIAGVGFHRLRGSGGVVGASAPPAQ